MRIAIRRIFGGIASPAHLADRLTAANSISGFNEHAVKVAYLRNYPVSMIYGHLVAISASVTAVRANYLSGSGCIDRFANRSLDVYALMCTRRTAVSSAAERAVALLRLVLLIDDAPPDWSMCYGAPRTTGRVV